MSRAMEQVMCFAVLGFVAFTLQGCGDTAAMQAHLQQFAEAAAGHIQSAKTAAVSKSLQAAEGCPPLLASTKEHKGEIISKVYEKVIADGACKSGAAAFADAKVPVMFAEKCMKDTAFELADVTMFYAEADPGFKNWMKAHETVWNQISGVVDPALQEEYFEPVKVMYANSKTDFGTDKFKEYFTAEVSGIIDVTLKVFCPTSDEAVKKSMEKDDPLVEAAAATAKAKAVLKQDAFKEEVLDEAAAKAVAVQAATATAVDPTAKAQAAAKVADAEAAAAKATLATAKAAAKVADAEAADATAKAQAAGTAKAAAATAKVQDAAIAKPAAAEAAAAKETAAKAADATAKAQAAATAKVADATAEVQDAAIAKAAASAEAATANTGRRLVESNDIQI